MGEEKKGMGGQSIEGLYLEKLSKENGLAHYTMLKEIDVNDNGFHNEVSCLTYEEFRTWLKRNEGYSTGHGLKDWMVPQTTYWLHCCGVPIGYGRIRHALTDHLRKKSGHVGYALAQSYRGKGYGSLFLDLLLKKCLEMGINPVQIGVGSENIRSNKLVQANGGKLVKVVENKNIYQVTIGEDHGTCV